MAAKFANEANSKNSLDYITTEVNNSFSLLPTKDSEILNALAKSFLTFFDFPSFFDNE